jgi:hypothetical protein
MVNNLKNPRILFLALVFSFFFERGFALGAEWDTDPLWSKKAPCQDRLFLAAFQGTPEQATDAMEQGADPQLDISGSWLNCIAVAAWAGNLPVLKVLVGKGDPRHAQGGGGGMSDRTRRELENRIGRKISHRDAFSDRLQPFVRAVGQGHRDTCLWLAQQVAAFLGEGQELKKELTWYLRLTTNYWNNHSWPSCTFEENESRLLVMAKLLELGADPGGGDMRTFFIPGLGYEGDFEALECLLQNGADASLADSLSQTVFHLLVEPYSYNTEKWERKLDCLEKTIRLLKKLYSEEKVTEILNLKDKYGNTVLDNALSIWDREFALKCARIVFAAGGKTSKHKSEKKKKEYLSFCLSEELKALAEVIFASEEGSEPKDELKTTI